MTSLSWAVAPLIFNNLYAATTDVHDVAKEEAMWGWHLPVGIVWGLMIFCSVIAFGVSLTVPDPRVIWIAVPDDNSSTGMVLLGTRRHAQKSLTLTDCQDKPRAATAHV